MHRLGICDLGSADDARDVEVATRAFRGTDADGFVRKAGVEAVTVRLGIDRDRLDAKVLAGTDHAKGNFAAVRD